MFILYPAPDLLERRARQRTAHAALIAQLLDLLAGSGGCGELASPRLAEPLSHSELRVLRYLPTHLSAPEIASELSVSLSTVETHMRNLYAKLGGHSRAEAVERALLWACSHRPRTFEQAEILRIVGGGFIRPSTRLGVRVNSHLATPRQGVRHAC